MATWHGVANLHGAFGFVLVSSAVAMIEMNGRRAIRPVFLSQVIIYYKLIIPK